MRFQLNFQRLVMFSFLVPALAACLAVMPSMPSDDKCPDGSKKDPELGCRQSTRVDMSHATADKKLSVTDRNVYLKRKGASSSEKDSSASSSDAVASTGTSSTSDSTATSSSADTTASSASTEFSGNDDKCPDGSKKDPELGCRQSTRVANADNERASKQNTAKKSRSAKKAAASRKASRKKGETGAADSNPK
jgi:hypothetical protein